MNTLIYRFSEQLRSFGAYLIFALGVISRLPMAVKRRYEVVRQMKKIGFDSFLLILITSAFSGLVTAVQASYLTKGYIPTDLIGVMVGKSTMAELGPVLTALVLSGRVGASLAAEIGTMKVSEQLEAIEALAIDPLEFLYMPRMLAGFIMIPMLTVYANVVSLFSAYALSHFYYGISFEAFFMTMRDYFLPSDIWGGLLKSLVFGFAITTIGCFIGTTTRNGAEGVGEGTTKTVVITSIVILLLDFVVAYTFFGQ